MFNIQKWGKFSVPVATYIEKTKKKKLGEINSIENLEINIPINKYTLYIYSLVLWVGLLHIVAHIL